MELAGGVLPDPHEFGHDPRIPQSAGMEVLAAGNLASGQSVGLAADFTVPPWPYRRPGRVPLPLLQVPPRIDDASEGGVGAARSPTGLFPHGGSAVNPRFRLNVFRVSLRLGREPAWDGLSMSDVRFEADANGNAAVAFIHPAGGARQLGAAESPK